MAGNANPSFSLVVNNTGIASAPLGNGNTPLIIGWTSAGSYSGSPGVGVYSFSSVPSLTATLGTYGNAIDAASLCLAQGASSVLVYKAFSGTIGSETFTGSGTGRIAQTGQPTAPFGSGQGGSGILVQITLGSTTATTYGTFAYSLDGGVTYSSSIANPGNAGTFLVPGTGVTLTFNGAETTGVWVTGDLHVSPITTGTGQMYPYGASIFSAQQVSATGSTTTVGEGCFTADSTANPLDAFQVLIQITKSGVLGVAQYVYSFDGGITFGSNATIASGGTVTLPGGVVLDAANGNTAATYTWNDSTDTNSVTFSAGTSFQGYLGNNLKVVVATGSSLANSISVAGNITTVTLTIDTTVTTPALLNTYVNTTAAAALAAYINISAHSGTTAFTVFLASTALTGGVGNGGSTSGFIAGEKYLFNTLGPQMVPGDVVNILANLVGNPNTWGWLHIPQACNTTNTSASPGFELSTLFTDVNTACTSFFTAGQYVGAYALIDAPVDTVTSNIDSTLETWAATAASDYISVGAGTVPTASAANGWQLPRNANWSLSARLCTTPLGQDAAWVATGPLGGVNSTGFGTIYRNEANTPGLGPAGFVPLWTIGGLNGIYITNPNIMCSNTSDISLAQYRRVLNAACQASRKALIQFLSGYVRTTAGGQIDPRDIANIDNVTQSAALSAVNGQVQTVTCTLSPVIGAGGAISMTVAILSFNYIKIITATIGYTSPALSAAAA